MGRYQKLPGSKGVFKDLQAGTYYAVKYVNKKKVSKTFNTPREARAWRESKKSFTELIDYDGELNGVKPFTFQEAWDKYKLIEYPKLQKSTIDVKEERCKFFDNLLSVKMVYITPDFIDEYILKKKESISKSMKSNRYSLKNELIELSAVLNFYQRHMDFKFINPVSRERHWPLGKFKDKPRSNKKMTEDEVSRFFAAMWELNEKDGLYAFLAEDQFLTAGRIQEPAARRVSKIDFETKTVTIDEAVSWQHGSKRFSYFKCTKTEATRYCTITPRMERNYRILISRLPENCDLLYNIDGRPLHQFEIYNAYERGLRRAGLWPKYTGTHIMRHSMAKQARAATGTLDGAQAVGGWASIKQCEGYADSPSHLQIEAANKVEQRLRLVN